VRGSTRTDSWLPAGIHRPGASSPAQSTDRLRQGARRDLGRPPPAPATIATTGLAENLTDDPIAAEAVKAEQHSGYDVDATYFGFTPPGHAAT
jgi:hypothetical protein